MKILQLCDNKGTRAFVGLYDFLNLSGEVFRLSDNSFYFLFDPINTIEEYSFKTGIDFHFIYDFGETKELILIANGKVAKREVI